VNVIQLGFKIDGFQHSDTLNIIGMKTQVMMAVCLASLLVSGCAAGISRTGYKLPPGQTSKDLPLRPIAIQYNAKYDTNDVVVLGSIHDYDTSVSTHCDEAFILDIFCREGGMLGADLINITEEHQPDFWSTCYRAKATFLKFKDREKAKSYVSDAKYSPEEITKRVTAANKRTEGIIIGAAVGGALGGAIGGAMAGSAEPGVTSTNNPSNTNSIPSTKNGHP
jgi:outer membrane lipoprotein SlyB